jgi:hypothetical protein
MHRTVCASAGEEATQEPEAHALEARQTAFVMGARFLAILLPVIRYFIVSGGGKLSRNGFHFIFLVRCAGGPAPEKCQREDISQM